VAAYVLCLALTGFLSHGERARIARLYSRFLSVVGGKGRAADV
jgi:hypothetical protein